MQQERIFQKNPSTVIREHRVRLREAYPRISALSWRSLALWPSLDHRCDIMVQIMLHPAASVDCSHCTRTLARRTDMKEERHESNVEDADTISDSSEPPT